LTIRAYGEGDKPTISGYDLLANSKFTRHDPDRYPNVWSQRVTPPSTYYIRFWEKIGAHPGVLVGGDRGLVYIWASLRLMLCVHKPQCLFCGYAWYEKCTE